MPNWCNNKLVISGTVEKIAEFKKTLGSDGDFKFSQTIPMPRGFQGIMVGNAKINGKQVTHWREQTLTPPRVKTRKARKAAIASYRAKIERNGGSKRVTVPVSEVETEYLVNKYGSMDWYSWAQTNWGTKWDTDSDTTMTEAWNQDGHAALVSIFDTAWAPPTNWVVAVSSKFPELTFEIHYSESGMGFYGTFTSKDGSGLEDYHEGMFRKDIDWDTIDNNLDAMTPEAKDFHEAHGFAGIPE
jgi:hypothetical protein